MSRRIEPDSVTWRDDVGAAEWDLALAALGGHPLQSALWGDARRQIDGIRDRRWMALWDGKPAFMLRCEERKFPFIATVGWVPRGPTGENARDELPSTLLSILTKSGVALLITDEWRRAEGDADVRESRPCTSWVDLSGGCDAVWRRFDGRFRQGIRRGQAAEIIVGETADDDDVRQFYHLCKEISDRKRFRLPSSLSIMKHLLREGRQGEVEARLFVARHVGSIAAGVFIIRCGTSIHYFWGGMNREASKERVGEAVHWAAIQWGIEKGCHLYDLEGMDLIGNKSVYSFKMKMGGTALILAGKKYYPINFRGKILSWIGQKAY